MKKVICATDMEKLKKEGGKVLYVTCDTIMTPSAKDVANECGIEVILGDSPCTENQCAPKVESCCTAEGCCSSEGLSSDLIYKALSVMSEKGMLEGKVKGMLEDVVQGKPYVAEHDPSGFKLVRGGSVKMEVLETGNPADDGKVMYQEVIGSCDKSSMNAGFLTIDRCTFDWDVACEEIYYIIEGSITVTIAGKTYTGNPGDELFIQKGSKVIFGTSGKVKVFYATYGS